jgi:DNA replication protein DnaC
LPPRSRHDHETHRPDISQLRLRARGPFLSTTTIDSFLAWATPRQIEAVGRLLATELENRERARRERLMLRAGFPVAKGTDGYDFANVKLPDGYTRDELLSPDFIPKAQDLMFYGKTGRGKTHPATALGVNAVSRSLNARFHQTAELVLQPGKAKHAGTLDAVLNDLAKADLIILDEFGYVPFGIDGARLLYQIIAGSYERRSIIFTTTIEFSKWAPSLPTTSSPPRFNRPHHPPRTTYRIHRTKPTHERIPHVQQNKPINPVRLAPCINPKKIHD